MGALFWTPELARILTELQLWNKAIKLRSGKRIDTRHLRRLAAKCGSPEFWTMSIAEMKQAQTAAYDRYKLYTQKHQEKRDTFISQLAEQYELAGKGSKKQILVQLRQREITRAANRMITAFTKDNKRRPLVGVTGPGRHNPEDRETFSTKAEIEQTCLAEGIERFTQAYRTTGADPRMLEALGLYGENSGADLILRGILPPELSSYPENSFVKRFLPFLAQPPQVRTFSWQFGQDEFQTS